MLLIEKAPTGELASVTWFDPTTAGSGWLGAVVTALVAGIVLVITLGQERKRSEAQAKAERELVLDQLRAERDAEREHRRVAAYGDFIAEMNEYLSFPSSSDALLLIQRRSDAALQRWMLYVDPADDEVALGVAGHRSRVVTAAKSAAWRARDDGPSRLSDQTINATVAGLAEHGREWHRDCVGREQKHGEAASWLKSGDSKHAPVDR